MAARDMLGLPAAPQDIGHATRLSLKITARKLDRAKDVQRIHSAPELDDHCSMRNIRGA